MKIIFGWMELKSRYDAPCDPRTLWAINLLLRLLDGVKTELSMQRLIVSLESGTRILLARDQDAGDLVIGLATLAPMVTLNHRYGHVEDVVLDPAYRRRGLGRTLMEMVHERARQLELTELELRCHPRFEEANILYRRLGYRLDKANHYQFNL